MRVFSCSQSFRIVPSDNLAAEVTWAPRLPEAEGYFSRGNRAGQPIRGQRTEDVRLGKPQPGIGRRHAEPLGVDLRIQCADFLHKRTSPGEPTVNPGREEIFIGERALRDEHGQGSHHFHRRGFYNGL